MANMGGNNPMAMLMQMMSMGNNPQQIIQNMVSRNPQVQQIMTQVQNSGLTPQQYVQQYAKQNNINIEPMLNMLRQRGMKI